MGYSGQELVVGIVENFYGRPKIKMKIGPGLGNQKVWNPCHLYLEWEWEWVVMWLKLISPSGVGTKCLQMLGLGSLCWKAKT